MCQYSKASCCRAVNVLSARHCLINKTTTNFSIPCSCPIYFKIFEFIQKS